MLARGDGFDETRIPGWTTKLGMLEKFFLLKDRLHTLLEKNVNVANEAFPDSGESVDGGRNGSVDKLGSLRDVQALLLQLVSALNELETQSTAKSNEIDYSPELGKNTVEKIINYVQDRKDEFQIIFNSLAELEKELGDSALVTKHNLFEHVQGSMKMAMTKALSS